MLLLAVIMIAKGDMEQVSAAVQHCLLLGVGDGVVCLWHWRES